MEGERYIKTPELAREYFEKMKPKTSASRLLRLQTDRAISKG